MQRFVMKEKVEKASGLWVVNVLVCVVGQAGKSERALRERDNNGGLFSVGISLWILLSNQKGRTQQSKKD